MDVFVDEEKVESDSRRVRLTFSFPSVVWETSVDELTSGATVGSEVDLARFVREALGPVAGWGSRMEAMVRLCGEWGLFVDELVGEGVVSVEFVYA